MAQPDVRDADFPLDEAFLEDFGCRWWAAWNAHDPRRVTALCTPDVEWRPLHGAGARPCRDRGRDGDAPARLPRLPLEPTEPPYGARRRRKAIAPWRCTGTMTGRLDPPGFAPTGRRLAWHGDDHWEFRRDLVCRCESICDVYAIAMRIGAVPAPGSRGEQVAVMLQHLGARRARRG